MRSMVKNYANLNLDIESLVLKYPWAVYNCEGPGTFISKVTVCRHVTDDRDRGEAAILPVLPDEKLRRRLWNHLLMLSSWCSAKRQVHSNTKQLLGST